MHITITINFHPDPLSKQLLSPLGEQIQEFIKDMFLMYRLDKLKLSSKWLTEAFNRIGQHRTSERQVRHYLMRERGLEPSSAPMRIKIPIVADYSQLNTQGHPEITAFHEETARFYTLLVQDWLTEEELQVFKSPFSEAAEPQPVA